MYKISRVMVMLDFDRDDVFLALCDFDMNIVNYISFPPASYVDLCNSLIRAKDQPFEHPQNTKD